MCKDLLSLLYHHITKHLQISEARDGLRWVPNIWNKQSRRQARGCHLAKVKVDCPYTDRKDKHVTQNGHLTARLGTCIMWTVTPCSLSSEEDTASILGKTAKTETEQNCPCPSHEGILREKRYSSTYA
jgi:hypothetical protein